ncbi:MAG: PD-(D/E)XK nuclease family protein [Chitinophagaceae bacterium]
MTRLVATDPIAYRKPARCGKRLWLKERGFERGPQDAFSAILAELGIEHEKEHANNDLLDHVDLGELGLADQVQRTLEEVEKGQRVIYQGAFAIETDFGGNWAEVVGLPDFLIPDGDSHIIRDAKLARTIGSKRVDIQLQLQIYGWLYETASGKAPTRLEVYNGKREIDEVLIDHEAALEELEKILELKLLPEEPFEPVGYTKCMGCAYQRHCWPAAEEDHVPGLIPAIDVGLGWALQELGIETYEQVGELGEGELAAIVKPHGEGEQHFGSKRASLALAQIEAFEEGRAIQIGEIALPEASHFVMFDVEDLPPDADGPDQVYLWGLQVYPADGGEPGGFDRPCRALASLATSRAGAHFS